MAKSGTKLTRKGVIAIVVAAVLVLGGAAGATWWMLNQTPADVPNASKATQSATPTPKPKTVLKVAAMGDMLPHDAVNKNALQADGTYDYGQFFTNILPIYKGSDVVFCNQEVPSAGEEMGISGYPVFNAPKQFAVDLRAEVGCNAINLATNHAGDVGPAGITLTRDLWDTLDPLMISGANRSAEEQNTIRYADVEGVKFSLVSFAEYSNSGIDDVSLNKYGNTALFEKLISEARANSDIVMVSMHWGTEDSHQVNANQTQYAQRAADLGADVIIGTGPHVLQPVTWLNRADGGKTLVWYSIGNMLSTQLQLDQRTGVIATFEVNLEGDKPVIENPVAHLTYLHYDWTAEQEAAGELLSRTNLSLNPLASSAELLAKTRFQGASVDSILANMTAVLGPDVKVVAD